MALRISGRGVDLGEALRTRVEERVEAVLGKYAAGAYSGHVTVTRDGTSYRTDCVLHLTSGATLEASGAAHDAHASFDQTSERLEKRVRRYRRRLKDRPSNGADNGALPVEAAYAILEAPQVDDTLDDERDDDLDEAAEDEGLDGAEHPLVIAETRQPVHRRSVSEAVADLDLTDAPVVVFIHAGTERVNVVYRRRDGSIGWIDPPERRAS
jgi:ribosomal subunit interface protein